MSNSVKLAVGAVVEPGRHIRRHKAIDREVVAFSMPHEHRPEEDARSLCHHQGGKKVTYYCNPVGIFGLPKLYGKGK